MTGAALVTGANRGIGLALVSELRSKGFRPVIAAYRDAQRSRDLLDQAKHDPLVVPVHVDVTDQQSVDELSSSCARLVDRVDLVVNNAGIAATAGTIMTAPVGELERHVQTHAIGAVRVTRSVDGLLKAGSVVVNVSSVLSSMSSIGSSFTFYSVAKALQNALTLQLASSLRARGVVVLAVHPGWVATEIGGVGAPTSPRRSAHGVVGVALAATISDTGSFIDFEGRHIPW